jgi:hypothetical protein
LNQDTRKFDFSVLDGVRMNVCKDLVNELKSATVRQLILKSVFVTSLQFDSHHGNEPRGVDFCVTWDMSFDSWRESDYDKAAESAMVANAVIRRKLLKDWKLLKADDADEAVESYNPEQVIDDNAKVKEAMKLKYYFAGGCARFMFEYDFLGLKLKLKRETDEKLSMAVWEEFASSTLARKATSSVNSLLQRFTDKGDVYCVPVSEYVLRRAYSKCGGMLAESVAAAANSTKNPTLLDWAFELAELDKIQRALAQNQQSERASQWASIQAAIHEEIVPSRNRFPPFPPPTTGGKNKLIFFPQSEAKFNGTMIIGKVQDGTVIWCEKWNQGCFDVAFYINSRLVTVQISSRQTSHSLKLQYVKKLRKALLQKNVALPADVDVVHLSVVKGGVEGFFFGDAEGAGQATRRMKRAFHVKVMESPELVVARVRRGASVCDIDTETRRVPVYDLEA